jgi:Stage II sporulation protein E (SpoIIE)
MTMDERPGAAPGGFADRLEDRPREENLGERLLGSLLDRAHLIPPRLVGPLVTQELRASGALEVTIYLQDRDQRELRPLPGSSPTQPAEPIDESAAGRAFSTDERVEERLPDGSVRLHLPMLDGSDRIGVLTLTLPRVDDVDRRLAQRVAGLVADMIVTKSMYTDTFERVRTREPMSLSAHLQWQNLPPLTMNTPDVELAGVLEPVYSVGGDSFDYSLDDHVLQFAVLDAMGHGLDAAVMATVLLAAYRTARRAERTLQEVYADADAVLARTFPGRFATAQFARLDSESGELTWVNAGHPAALWVRDARVIAELSGRPTRPVGFGGAVPAVERVQLEPGDRLLFFTDGVVEERLHDGRQFGEDRLRELLEKATAERLPAAETVRRLSHALMEARHGRTSDDASLLLVEWKSPPRDDELARGIAEATPTAGAV